MRGRTRLEQYIWSSIIQRLKELTYDYRSQVQTGARFITSWSEEVTLVNRFHLSSKGRVLDVVVVSVVFIPLCVKPNHT